MSAFAKCWGVYLKFRWSRQRRAQILKKKRNITRQGNILLTGQNLKQKGPWMNEGHPNHCSYKDSLLNSCNIAFRQRREGKKKKKPLPAKQSISHNVLLRFMV